MDDLSRDEKVSSANPLSTIFRHLNKTVSVHLKNGERYSGNLAKVDNHMNLVLMDTIEERADKVAKYGKVLIRGNNILFLKLE